MKLKKVMSLLVVLVMFFGVTINIGIVKADTLGDFTYVKNWDGTITITGYKGSSGVVRFRKQLMTCL